ncbi:MAG: hypothetical protein M1820_001022 [Bogoriella megaspora]|nr:MAG: hypothetical protein M1820_001022 [Bogoriella megaspora]
MAQACFLYHIPTIAFTTNLGLANNFRSGLCHEPVHPSLPDPIVDINLPGMKRARAPDDVDGPQTASFQSKKQRLHLNLFTSRLSTPYAAPSTYIVNRGRSKIAVWAKQKGLGAEVEGALRRVAGINRLKQQFEKRCDIKKLGSGGLNTAKVVHQRSQNLTIPPSPLGVSNYAALDDEDTPPETNEIENEEDGIYSDFNVLDPVDPESPSALEEAEQHSVFARVPLELSPCQLRREEHMAEEVVSRHDRPPSPPDELLKEMIREKEGGGEAAFVEL